MILVLRVISQICQCFEDKTLNQDSNGMNKMQSDYPLYLREKNNNRDSIEKQQFLKTLDSFSSRRSGNSEYKQLVAIDTKRPEDQQSINIPQIYMFPTEQEYNSKDPKDTKDNINQTQRTSSMTPDTEDEPKQSVTQDNNNNNLVMLIQENSGEDQIDIIDDLQQVKLPTNALDKEINARDKEIEDLDLQIIQHIKTNKPKPNDMLDLETRVKKHHNKKKKQRAPKELQTQKSPYRVNLPKDLAHFAQAHRTDD